MNKTIWKYRLETTKAQALIMPLGSEILTVQVQHDELFLWALIDPYIGEIEERNFEIYGTGEYIHVKNGVELKHIGSYQLNEGHFFGHLFEMIS